MTLEQMISELKFIEREIAVSLMDNIEETEDNMKHLAQARDDLEYAISELEAIHG